MVVTKREMLMHNSCTTVKDFKCHVKMVFISSGMSTYDME